MLEADKIGLTPEPTSVTNLYVTDVLIVGPVITPLPAGIAGLLITSGTFMRPDGAGMAMQLGNGNNTLYGNTYFYNAAGSVVHAGLTTSAINLYVPVVISGAAGTDREVFGTTVGVTRWALVLGNDAAEVGANAGSDFALLRYDDGGNFLGTAFTASRSSGGVWFADNIFVSPTKALYFDGGVDTYIFESSADVLDVYVGAVEIVAFTPTTSYFKGAVSLASTYQLFFDGGNDTYIFESSANTLELVAAGNTMFEFTGTTMGFYGVAPTARQLLPTGAGKIVDDVITALQNLGLVRQS